MTPVVPTKRPQPRPQTTRHGRPIEDDDPAAWLGKMSAVEALNRGYHPHAVYSSLVAREVGRALRMAEERHAREIARLNAIVAAAQTQASNEDGQFVIELVMISPDGVQVPFRISGDNLEYVRREYDAAIPALIARGWRQVKSK